MRKLFTKDLKQSLAVDAGQVLSIQTEVAETLQITCGRVWITVSGHSDDYWLGAGQYLNVAAGSHVVLEADKGRSVVERRQQAADGLDTARAGCHQPVMVSGKLQYR